jgi:hypothetical protein
MTHRLNTHKRRELLYLQAGVTMTGILRDAAEIFKIISVKLIS